MALFYLLISFCFLQAAIGGEPATTPPSLAMETIVQNSVVQIKKMWEDLQCQCFHIDKPGCSDESLDTRETICDGIKRILDDKDVNPQITVSTIPPTTESTTSSTAESTISPTTESKPPTTTELTTTPTPESTTPPTTVSTTPSTTASTTLSTIVSKPPTTTELTTTPTPESTTPPTTVSTTPPTTVSTTPPTTVSTTPPTTVSTTPPTTESTTPPTNATTTVSPAPNPAADPYNNNDKSSGNGIIVAVALGCFILGALVVIVAKLLHNHYRQKSYALPPEQEMS